MIRLTDIRKNFGSLEVLKGVSLSVDKGEIVSIVGPSGAGKSTLLQIAGTLDTPTSGDVIINNISLSTLTGSELAAFRNKTIGFVFQFHHLLPEFSALENVMLPAMIAGVKRKECEERARELLQMLSLGERLTHKPSQLSGGEAQRVAIARAMINNPALILADEPSGNLDSVSRDEFHNSLINMRDSSGVTIVIVTHDNELASRSDRVIELRDGKIVK